MTGKKSLLTKEKKFSDNEIVNGSFFVSSELVDIQNLVLGSDVPSECWEKCSEQVLGDEPGMNKACVSLIVASI